MRRLLSTTALVAALFFVPREAEADPIVVSLATAAGATGLATFASSAIGAAIINIGASLVLTALTRPKMPKQPDMRRELSQPTSRPPYRFVYGRTIATGTPAPMRVEGDGLYMALLLSSRPSAATNITIYADKRPCTIEAGSLSDWAGPGANLKPQDFRDWDVTEDYFTAWLQDGSRTTPPDRLWDAAYPNPSRWEQDFFDQADGWQGRTVLWCRFNAGGSQTKRPDRWPAAPPVIEVVMDWTPVWDPRDGAQDPDDPATWTFSENQALILLDALRMNPVRRYPLSQIDLASFEDAADIADEAVTLKAGGTEPRYRAAGSLVFREGIELLDQLEPIAAAGGGRLVRTGGRIAYAPGAYRAPIYTCGDILTDGGVRYEKLRPGREMPRAIRTSFIRPAADWQEHELPLLTVAGGETPTGDDGVVNHDLDFVTSGTQAMRLQKIEAARAAAQESLACTLPPAGANLVGGANLTMALPAPWTRYNGIWQVDSIAPELNAAGEAGGVAMRLPVTLKREAQSFYAWTPATDEVDLPAVAFDPVPVPLAAPGTLTIDSDSIVDDNGYSKAPRIRFFFDPADGAVDGYEWEVRRNDNAWQSGGEIGTATLDAFGKVFGDFFPPEYSALYDLRVRSFQSRSDGRRASDWSQIDDVILDFDVTVNSAAAGPGAGEATFGVTTPTNLIFAGVKVYRAATGADFATAVAVSALIEIATNVTADVFPTGIAAGEADFWVVPVTASGSEAQPSGPYTLTIT